MPSFQAPFSIESGLLYHIGYPSRQSGKGAYGKADCYWEE